MERGEIMDAATLYMLIVCAGQGKGAACETPFGRVPSLTRQDCLEHSMLIRASHHSKRVICVKPDPIGGSSRPDDIIDSAGILRPEFPMAPSGK
jgi:hypothetical protein